MSKLPQLTPEERKKHRCQNSKKWRENHLEQAKQQTRKRNTEAYYQLKIENPEKFKKYIKEKGKKYRDSNPQKIRESKKRWLDKNEEKRKKYYQKRRAEQNSVECDLIEFEWKFCLLWFTHCCAYCLKYFENLEQDHFIPISKGGVHSMSNIIPACRSCNASKRDNDANDWLINKFGNMRACRVLMEIYEYFDHVTNSA